MEFDDDDELDDEPAAPLLPPDDRLWRHPSEISATGPTASAARPFPRSHEPRTMTVAALSSAISVLLTVGLVAAIGPLRTERLAETRIAPVVDTNTRPVSVVDVSGIADQLRPAVVRIEATAGNSTRWGSAILIRSDGVMLTAAHLVAGAKSVRATLADGTKLQAKVVGIDDDIDIAVLDLEGDGYASAVIGSATRLRVGEPAITLGAPGDDGGATVTAGIVGGLGRTVEYGG
ncbi:MAG: S1C family serine protease, partial [Acidimicrobiales bacterium]